MTFTPLNTGSRWSAPSPEAAPARWEERRSRSVLRSVRALTTLNAVGPLGVLTLAGGFLFARVGLVARVYAGRTFPALRFIHFASWSLVRNLPAADPDKRVRLSNPYLLFVTNFNCSFGEYIDAFSYTVGWRISNIWRFSYGSPGPRPSEAFKAYIERQEVPSLHYYAAYPHPST